MATKPFALTDEDYEKQPHLVFKKGTRVRVTGIWQENVDKLQAFHDEHIKDLDASWRKAARAALKERKAFIDAVGKVYKVVGYFIGANPHIIKVNGVSIGLPKEYLEAV